jgi:MFS family permease
MAGVLLGLHLTRLGLPAVQIGAIVGAGLSGAAGASLVVMLLADRLGRRATLVTLALLAALGGVAVAATVSPWPLAVFAFLGMLNGMGRDRGAALVLEQAALPSTTDDGGRTRVFALYNVAQDAGHALGSLLAALPLPGAFLLYAGLNLLLVPFYLGLSRSVEVRETKSVRVSPASRRLLLRLSALFALDSLGGGFLTAALLSVFFLERFGTSPGMIGALFFGARVANAFSHLGAAWLARRIGLVNTMVFTHIPSSLLLVTVAIAPSFPVAALLFLLREGLVEMDVPTRQSYVMAVVKPEERTFASGLTHLVRMGAWAVAPFFAGAIMQRSLLVPLLIAAALKVSYDVLLYVSFRRTVPPEERGLP